MIMKHTRIVGAKFRGAEAVEACRNLPQSPEPNPELTLVPEPENPYDPNAIKVLLRGDHIGYIPAALAKSLQAAITPDAEVKVTVSLPGDNPEIFVEVA